MKKIMIILMIVVMIFIGGSLAFGNELLGGSKITTKEFTVGGDKVIVGGGQMLGSNKMIFEPEVILYKWGNETYIRIWADDNVESRATERNNKIISKSKDGNREYNFYSLTPEEVGAENGGFEYEVILKKKPKTNVITLNIETKGLEFYYQPPENELDGQGYANERDIGSYAVYHKEKMNKILSVNDRKKYQSGKAFHIYRPQMEDADGWKVWGELNIENGILTVIIPQNFLNNAEYPIKHATGLTFGNTTKQAEHAGGAKDWIHCSDFTGSASYGISISSYFSDFSSQVPYIKYTAYTRDSLTEGTLIDGFRTGVWKFTAAFDGWKELNFKTTGGQFAATDYWLCFWMGDDGADIYYDTVEDAGGSGNYTFGDWPSTITIADSNRIYSIYATYEEEQVEDLSMTFYPEAGDGVIGSGYIDSWDTFKSTTTGPYVDYTSATHWSDVSWDPVGAHREYNGMRMFFPFDTSALPDNAVIASSTLYTFRAGGGLATSTKAGGEIFDYSFYGIVNTTQDSSSELVNTDWDECGDNAAPEIGGSGAFTGDDVYSGTPRYYPIKLTPTALGWISATGTTWLGMRPGEDLMDNPNGLSTTTETSGQFLSYSEHADTSEDPYLEVWYSVPAAIISDGLRLKAGILKIKSGLLKIKQ